jgi:hypothetical protein
MFYYNHKIKQLKSYSTVLNEKEMAMRNLVKIDDVDAFRKMGDGEKSDFIKSLGIDIEQPKKKVVVSPVVVKEIKPIETELIEVEDLETEIEEQIEEEVEMDAELQDLTNQYFEKLGKYPPKDKANNKKFIQKILTQNI